MPAVEGASEVGEVDVVVVATKSWQLASLAEVLEPLVGPDTVVFGIQNGVEAARRPVHLRGSLACLGWHMRPRS